MKNNSTKIAGKKQPNVKSAWMERLIKLYSEFENEGFQFRADFMKFLDKQFEIIKGRRATDKGGLDICTRIKSAFLQKHIELTVKEVSEKYGIAARPTEKDFYRICEGENIIVLNQDDHFQKIAKRKKSKTGFCIVIKELPDEAFLLFADEKTGKERLEEQFLLLGFHFLHKRTFFDNYKIKGIKGQEPYEQPFFCGMTTKADRLENMAQCSLVFYLPGVLGNQIY